MPLSRRIARLNKVGLNRVSRHLAPYLPGFGVVIHRGRRSGRTFRTPVNVFRRPGSYLFALTYGSDADWVRNVRAAGRCELVTRGRTVRLTDPTLFVDETREGLPFVVRTILRWNKVDEFLSLKVESPR